MTDSKTISYEVKEHLGVIAEYNSGWNKELNLISWNGAAPKYDIRDWDETHTHMSKGITLFEGEMQTLMDVYIQAKNRRIFEEAKTRREERTKEIEAGKLARARRKEAQDRAIAARAEAAAQEEALSMEEPVSSSEWYEDSEEIREGRDREEWEAVSDEENSL